MVLDLRAEMKLENKFSKQSPFPRKVERHDDNRNSIVQTKHTNNSFQSIKSHLVWIENRIRSVAYQRLSLQVKYSEAGSALDIIEMLTHASSPR